MVRIENHCCGCATEYYPCQGAFCSRRRVEVHYCDKCGKELRDHEISDWGEELCSSCLEGDDADVCG